MLRFILGFLLLLDLHSEHIAAWTTSLPPFGGATRSQFRALEHLNCFRPSLVPIQHSLIFGVPLWGEGCVTSMGDTRAGTTITYCTFGLPAKQHGMGPQQILGSQTGSQREVCKRSYKRALHRAELHGVTWYKGKLLTAKQMGVTMKAPPTLQPSPNVAPPKSIQRKRLTCFSWNSNGLPPAHWDFLMMWLENQTIDVLLLPRDPLALFQRRFPANT